ncbi:MAG: flagellar hook-associated protein FlgK [Maritimibacter sp.]|nr:flagellar hook-associated protein FlgK [Maritimibacter sp.]
MSISSALGAALSGLTAASRRAEVVSSNVANASTPGYGRRQVELGAGLVGSLLPGVTVAGGIRNEDVVLLGQRREAQAGLAYAETGAEFLTGIEAAIGIPGEPNSLSQKLTAFETALIEASSRPDSDARLLGVANTASDVTNHLNTLADRIQDERLLADQRIDTSVDRLNTALQQVVDLNNRIVQFQGSTRDATSLIDQRQSLIDGIADLIPIRQTARDNGAVALYTEGGAVLVDSKAAVFDFQGATALTVYMTQAGGGLSGLTINGQAISTGATSGPIAGGRLAALFEIRDETAPALQVQLDAVARDLMERFETPTVDPTLAVGDPGLFTDNGLAFDPVEETGLAARITLNAVADPDQGGAVWRLRDGLNAPAVGDPGNAAILDAMSVALSDLRTPLSGGFTTSHNAVGLAGDLLSRVAISAHDAETRVGFTRAQTDALLTAEYQDGVDTDQEMQELLLIEQAYSANARVIQTIDALINRLLEI